MRRKARYIARIDEVTISRDGENAVITYNEPGIYPTHFAVGPKINELTDKEILEIFNNHLREVARFAAEHKYVAVETPLGSPQIRYSVEADQWSPRGNVLRCQISDMDGQAIILIDDQELTIEEFGRMLTTYSGWGMRIEFVDDDRLHHRPPLEVREPDEK